MSKRKGVSAEEKRTRMLQIFHESHDFYQLKDLEKIAPKQKGIIAQSVKDVVQSLVDEGLVDSDKIGTSIYFWSYPSKTLNLRKRKLQDLITQTEELTKKLKTSKEKMEKEKVGKEESESRITLLKEVENLNNKRTELNAKLQKYEDNDPEVLQKMENNTKTIIEAVNRWTDNILAIKSWCRRKFNIEESLLDKQFEIPSNLDYMDN